MRVIAGSARGTHLAAPESATTRPTSDKVKGAIFSMVAPFAPFTRVLDLYAGTGALGIEALSRWGGHATFVEERQQAWRVLQHNLERTRLQAFSQIERRSVAHALRDVAGPFDLVLVDPPYADPEIGETMHLVGRPGFVMRHGVVVLEHSARWEATDNYGTLTRWKSRRHGDTTVSVYLLTQRVVEAAPGFGESSKE